MSRRRELPALVKVVVDAFVILLVVVLLVVMVVGPSVFDVVGFVLVAELDVL